MHELVETGFEGRFHGLGERAWEFGGGGWIDDAGFRGVVEQIGRPDCFVFGVPDDGGLEGVEGEVVCDFLRRWVLLPSAFPGRKRNQR